MQLGASCPKMDTRVPKVVASVEVKDGRTLTEDCGTCSGGTSLKFCVDVGTNLGNNCVKFQSHSTFPSLATKIRVWTCG